MKNTRLPLACLSLGFLAGCGGGSSGAGLGVLPASATMNTALTSNGAVEFVGGRVLLRVPEFAQGGVDLNGDGDAFDSIVHLYHPSSGLSKNFRWSAFGTLLTERFVLLQVSEFERNEDLDGDGDADSMVLVIEEIETAQRSAHELRDGLGVGFPMISDGRWVLVGRTGTNSIAIELASGDVQDLGHPVGGFYDDGLQLGGGRAIFTTLEEGEDLNGDGDAFDQVLVVTDLLTRTSEVPPFSLVTGELQFDGQRLLVFQALENDGGATDLNGDGDANDHAQVLLDLDARAAFGLPGAVQVSPRARFAEDFAVVQVDEGFQTDLNLDGDLLDNALVIYDAASSTLETLPVSVNPDWFLSDTHLVFAADEARNGNQDLDGDGDGDGLVVHAFELATGALRNLNQEVDPSCACALVLEGSALALLVGERATGTSGSGDPGLPESADPRLFIHDLARGTRRDLGFEPSVLQASFQRRPGRRFAFDVFPESPAPGSLLDSYIYDFETRRVTKTGLRLVDILFGPDDDFAARIHEGGVEDLNGDGDRTDVVLVVGRF